MTRKSIIYLVVVSTPVAAAAAQAPGAGAPMTGVGMPLPLRGDETVVPWASGCGSIESHAPDSKTAVSYQKMKWFGACRFGLVDGQGLIQSNPNYYSEHRYRYGIMLNGLSIGWLKSSDGRWSPGESEMYSARGRPESLFFYDWSDRPETLDGSGLPTRYPSLSYTASPMRMFFYHTELNWCSGTASVAPAFVQKFAAADQGSVAASCNDKLNKIRYVKYEMSETRADKNAFADGQISHLLEARNYLCAAMSDCRQAWNAALASQWPDIQRVKGELTTGQDAYISELERRMASLEAAYQSKLKRFAAARPGVVVKPKQRKRR